MKPFYSLIVLLLLTACVEAGEKKALLIMLDGLRADAAYSAATPVLDSLRDGSWAKNYQGAWTFQAHSIQDSAPNSATNHVAIATGVTATKHGVFENGNTAKGNYAEYPTWLSRLRKKQPEIVTAWLHNWSENTAIPTDADFQSTCGEGFDGDQKLIEQAKQILAGTLPETAGENGTKWTPGKDIDAMMLYLDSLDMFGHRFGFSVHCPEYFEKVAHYDGKVGELLETLKNRPNFAKEDWLIVVIADHGGTGRGHGIVGCKNCYTVPLIVSGKNIATGRMQGQPLTTTPTAYLMKHFTGKIPECFASAIPTTKPEAAPKLDAGKISLDAFQKESRDGSFSFALWFKANDAQKDDPPLFSNKNWADGLTPGVALAANMADGTAGCRAWLNLGDGERREDFRPLEYQPNEWTFFAVTVDRKENAVLYVGGADGRLSFISHDVTHLKKLTAGMPWNVGQDGTGKYPHTPDGEIQGPTCWNRALTTDEVAELYRAGK